MLSNLSSVLPIWSRELCAESPLIRHTFEVLREIKASHPGVSSFTEPRASSLPADVHGSMLYRARRCSEDGGYSQGGMVYTMVGMVVYTPGYTLHHTRVASLPPYPGSLPPTISRWCIPGHYTLGGAYPAIIP